MTDQDRHSLRVASFAFLLVTVALSAAGAALVFALALQRGTDATPGRWLLLVVIGSLGAALLVAAHLDPTGAVPGRSLTAGIAAAGIVAVITGAAGVLLGSGGVGPVDIAVAASGAIVVAAAPRIASLVERWRLPQRFASLGTAPAAPPSGGGITPREWVAVIAGLGLLIVALAYVLPTGTLGHDESVYAVKARSWIDGSPATGFPAYRPVGMPMVGWVVLQLDESEVALRVAATMIAVGVVATLWAIGRTMLGPAAALLGTATFMVSDSYLRRATEFLNDLAAAGLLLGALFFIWFHFERHPDRWWLLAAAPAAAAAYYMRYGSAFGLIVIAVVGGAIWWRGLRGSWRQIAATAGLLGTLLIPHFWYSQRLTGSVLGVMRAAQQHAGGVGGLGLDDYVEFFPARLTGTFGAILIVAGVAYTIMLAMEARRDPQFGSAARTAGFLTVSAVAMTVLLGLFTHGEPRFIFLPMMALLLVGGQAAAAVLARMPGRWRRAGVAVLIVLLAYALGSGAGQMRNRLERITSNRDVIAESSELVRIDAGTGTCTVYSAHIPQVTWYSVCATYSFNDVGATAEAEYLVVFTDSPQPSPAQLEALTGGANGDPLAVVADDGGVYGDGYIFELERARP